MATPPYLSGTDEIEPQDLLSVWSSRNRDARRVSFAQFRDAIADSVENDLDIAVASANASADIAQAAADNLQADLSNKANKSDLAATYGAGLVGTANGTVQQALDANQAVGTASVKKTDLAASTGSDSIGTNAAPVSVPYVQTLSQILRGESVSLFRFIDPAKHAAIRAFTSAEDIALDIQSAFNSGAKRIQADFGLYNMDSTAVLPGALTLEGAGSGTIFNQRAITQKASFYYNSGSATVLANGFQFRDFLIQCTIGTFFEQQHLIELSGVRNCLIEAVKFHGFRGDGLYIGSGGAGQERHNVNVQVRQCVFDGLNNANRNGISVIDGDGILIEDNSFFRCTQSSMPGPIDFEPDAASFHVIRNVTVRRNRFRSNGGNVGEVSIYAPAAVEEAPSNITVESNDSDGYVGTGSFFFYGTSRSATATTKECDLRLIRNKARNGSRPWQIVDGKRIEIISNGWSDMKQSALLGYTGATDFTRDVTIRDDAYTRVGTAGRIGVAIFNVAKLTMDNVDLIDCGDGNVGSYAIDFNSGTSSNVDMDRLKVSSPTGKTLVAVQKEAGHSFTTATNRFMRGTLNGLPNSFLAEESDELETAFTMLVAGQGVAGTWTPTFSFARYRRVGKEITVRAKVAGTLSGSAGALIFGLPVALQQDGNNQETESVLTVDGGAGYSTGGQVGLMTPALSLGGIAGVIRTFSTSTGALTLMAAPSGAFTAYIYARYKTP